MEEEKAALATLKEAQFCAQFVEDSDDDEEAQPESWIRGERTTTKEEDDEDEDDEDDGMMRMMRMLNMRVMTIMMWTRMKTWKNKAMKMRTTRAALVWTMTMRIDWRKDETRL